MKKIIIGFVLFLLATGIVFITGCGTTSVEVEAEGRYVEEPGPPPHAPAHGYRRKHYSYVYYPSSRIYFDINRNLYFYFDMGVWKSAAFLPGHITLIRSGNVSLEMDISTPYLRIREHERKYPPGHRKKGGKPPKRKPPKRKRR